MLNDVTFTIAIKNGRAMRGEVIELGDLDDEDTARALAQCTSLAHEMLAEIERIVSRYQAQKNSRAPR